MPDPLIVIEPGGAAATAAPHPEEMKASFELAVGDNVRMRAAYRATPAGLIAAALLIGAATLPWVWLFARRPTRD